HHDVTPRLGEGRRDAEPNPAGRAGDDSGLALQHRLTPDCPGAGASLADADRTANAAKHPAECRIWTAAVPIATQGGGTRRSPMGSANPLTRAVSALGISRSSSAAMPGSSAIASDSTMSPPRLSLCNRAARL